jgi:glycosyltransferase involved in cell wall biosynthesis
MRVVILSCVYPPEPVVSSQTSSQLAKGLVEKGAEVEVIAPFPSRPAGKLYKGYSRHLYRYESMAGGARLLRCLSIFSRKSTLFSRFMENVTFGLSSALALVVVRRPDVIYVNTWPLFAMGFVVIVAKLRRIPVVLSIQDVYPEVLVSQGRLRSSSVLARTLEWLDRLVVRHVESVAVISESFRQIYLRRGVSDNRLHLIQNWVDEQSVDPSADGAGFRQKLQIPKQAFLTVYGGNVATAAGVELAIRAFSHLDSGSNLYFCVAGSGANLDACRRLKLELGCKHIHFYSPWPTEETSEVLAAADLLLLPTYGAQSFASVPSKLISYMLAARPVLAVAAPESDMAVTFYKAGAGWVIPSDDVAGLARKWTEIAQLDRATLRQYGTMARSYAMSNMTKETCLPALLALIEQTRSG